MPVVQIKPPDDCEHVAWEVTGKSRIPGEGWREHRKCCDCGFRWNADDVLADVAEEEPGKPPKASYGHAQVVSYQTKDQQYDLVVGELAMVSVQNGLLVVQHHDSPVVGIVGVRPWLEEDRSGTDAEG